MGWAVDGLPNRLQAFCPTHRFIVADQALNDRFSQPGALRWADLRMDAQAENLDLVAEALARLGGGGDLLICVNWTDLLGIAGAGRRRTGHGRATVIDGVANDRLAAALHTELSRLHEEGFNGGLFVIQLLT